MSAADCRLGPLATAARERGEDVRVWRNEGHYSAEAGEIVGRGATAQDACDDLEILLGIEEVTR